MKLNQQILLALTTMFMISCSQEYVPASQNTDIETVIIAELEVGKRVSLVISSTYGPDTDAIRPSEPDGNVKITNLSNNQVDKGLRFDSNNQEWIQTSFKFNAGQELLLETDFEKIGFSKTSARITVPEKGFLSSKEAATITKEENDSYFTFSIQPSELTSDNYYHIKPYIIANNQISFLDITEIVENKAAVFTLSHMDGMLIDYQLLEGEKDLLIKAKSNSLSNQYPSTIYLLLKTVPEAYYEFHKSLTIQKETQQGPFDAPVPTYSNIEGGQGIFVAYQTTLDSIQVK